MSTDRPDLHDEPWLHDALGSLLLDEPSLAPTAVVDDVRRGATALTVLRRRRAATVAIAATILAVAVPVGLLVRSASAPTVPPPAASATPSSLGAADVKARLEPVLERFGWTITGSNEPTVPDSSGQIYTVMFVQPLSAAGDDTVPGSSITVVTYPQKTAPGLYLAGCTQTLCPGGVAMTLRDCAVGFDCWSESVAYPGANGDLLQWGSLVIDREYGSGSLVELVVGADDTTPTVSTSGPKPILSIGQARVLLDALGNPVAATPNPSTTTSSDGVEFLPDPQWESAVVAAFPLPLTPIVHPDLTSQVYVVSGRLVRTPVATSARVRLQFGGQDAVAPRVTAPCDVDARSSTSHCSVETPWSRLPGNGPAAYVSVIDVTTTTGTSSYEVRSALLARGETLLSVDADSRDVDAAGNWLGSTAPGLTPEELVALVESLPLPESARLAAERPVPGPTDAVASDRASAAASAAASAQADAAEAVRNPCASVDVALSLAFVDGIAGERAIGLVARNTSSKSCGLYGSPTVVLTSASGPLALQYVAGDYPGWPAVASGRAVLLAPGAEAHAIIAKPACSGAAVATATSISVQLPRDSSAAAFAVRGVAAPVQCPADEAPSNVVHVSAFESGGMN